MIRDHGYVCIVRWGRYLGSRDYYIQDQCGLAAAPLPPDARNPRAWRRSWMLGFAAAVITRVKAAGERAAADTSARPGTGPETSTALVLADPVLVIRRQTSVRNTTAAIDRS